MPFRDFLYFVSLKFQNKMLICCYCGDQLTLNTVFDHAFAVHSVPRYDERIYIPIYAIYRNLSIEVLPENAYTLHVTNMLIEIRRLYEILLVSLEEHETRPILDINSNEMGLNIDLQTPGNFPPVENTEMLNLLLITHQLINSL